MKEDYYKTLGVNKSSSSTEIKKAYKRLAMKYHPDRNPGDSLAEENFKKVSEAYEVLSDPQKKESYDRFGHDAFNFGSNQNSSTNHFTDIFNDIFGDVFNNSYSTKSNFNKRGSDLLHSIKITLEQAAQGFETNIKINTYIKCIKCKGFGAKNSSSVVNCQKCDGSGEIRIQQAFLTIKQTCSECGGSGSIIKDVCNYCFGEGRIKSNKNLSTKIPSGIDNEDKIRLVGEGEAGKNNAESGDLYIQINIVDHAIFTREGVNIHCEIPISLLSAILGGYVVAPTLKGKIKIKIPRGTQTNKTFRLKGKGIKSLKDNNIGDLFCKVIVETPILINNEQESLISDFYSSLKKENTPKESDWKNN